MRSSHFQYRNPAFENSNWLLIRRRHSSRAILTCHNWPVACAHIAGIVFRMKCALPAGTYIKTVWTPAGICTAVAIELWWRSSHTESSEVAISIFYAIIAHTTIFCSTTHRVGTSRCWRAWCEGFIISRCTIREIAVLRHLLTCRRKSGEKNQKSKEGCTS